LVGFDLDRQSFCGRLARGGTGFCGCHLFFGLSSWSGVLFRLRGFFCDGCRGGESFFLLLFFCSQAFAKAKHGRDKLGGLEAGQEDFASATAASGFSDLALPAWLSRRQAASWLLRVPGSRWLSPPRPLSTRWWPRSVWIQDRTRRCCHLQTGLDGILPPSLSSRGSGGGEGEATIRLGGWDADLARSFSLAVCSARAASTAFSAEPSATVVFANSASAATTVLADSIARA